MAAEASVSPAVTVSSPGLRGAAGADSPIRLPPTLPTTCDHSNPAGASSSSSVAFNDSWSDQDTLYIEKLRAMLPEADAEGAGDYHHVLVLAIEYIQRLEAMLK